MNNIFITDYILTETLVKCFANVDNESISMIDIVQKTNIAEEKLSAIFANNWGQTPVSFLQNASLFFIKNKANNLPILMFKHAENTIKTKVQKNININIFIEKFTAEEIVNKEKKVEITYEFYESKYGKCIIANTPKGVCFLAFIDNNEEEVVAEMLKKYSTINCIKVNHEIQIKALCFLQNKLNNASINLHLKATDFQINIWKELLKISSGNISTYAKIALQINNKNASRAVGNAIGNNMVAYIIPCHRVLQSSGGLGGFKWGLVRKQIMLAAEN